MRANTFKAILINTGFAASILLLGSGVAFAQSVNLTAAPTEAALPDGQTVPMWGYTCTGAAADPSAPPGTPPPTCIAANPSAGTNWSPVVITVPYNPSGTGLTINLTNNLQFSTNPPTNTTFNNVPTSLVIVGQLGGGLGGAPTRTPSPTHAAQGVTWFVAGPPDPSIDCTAPGAAAAAAAVGTNCPPGQSSRVQSFATEVAQGATAALCWGPGCTVPTPALKPGTYLIHSGTHPSIQSPMGLYGVLVVTTAPVTGAVPARGIAYSTPLVNYDAEVPLLLSEIDAVQNAAVATAVATAGFSETKVWNGQTGECGDPNASAGIANTCYPPAVNYDPRYYLINGVSFDRTGTNASRSLFATTPTTPATGTALVRFVNAGLRMHVPSVVGALTGSPAVSGFSLIAEDGNVLPGAPKVQTQVFLAAGKTYDVLMNAPASGPALPVYDRQLSLSTNNQRDGGMQGYISVNGSALPSMTATIVSASNKTYYCVAGTTLAVTDPSSGVLADATGANGAVLVTPTSLIGGDTSLVFQSNGTFSYTPPSSDCGGSFTYLVNGTLSKTATITRCDASTPGCAALGGAPTANNDSYTSPIASRLQISPPGVLVNDTDPFKLPLTAQIVGTPNASCPAVNGVNGVLVSGMCVNLNADGSFTAARTTGATGAPLTFQYNAVNSQKSSSATPATVAVTFKASTGLIVAVKDAKTGRAITDYRWIIEEDRTFYIDPNCQVNSTNPALRPASCPPLPIPTLGTNFHTSYMPVLASGCVVPVTGGISCELGQSLQGTAAACDVGNGACRTDVAQKAPVDPSQVYLDPTKRYYLSILPGDGGNPTIGGAGGAMQVDPNCDPATTQCAMRQFDIATDCGAYTSPPTGAWEVGGPGALCGHAMGGAPISSAQVAAGLATTINVNLQQTPLQTASITVFVFQDDWPLNGEHDAGGGVDVLSPQEAGLGGFELKILDQAGGFGDSTGQATYDMFNMPLSNGLAGMIDPVTGFNACPITKRTDGLVGMIPTCPKYEDGKDINGNPVLSPLAGQALIANLYPGLYEIAATPAADRIARGEEWLQTNTLDGTKPVEAFIKPGEPRYFQEFGPGGFHVAIGFANPKIINDRKGPFCANQTCTATLKGTVTNARMSRTPDQRVYSSGSYDSYSFTNCYVSVGDPNGADFAFTKCGANGEFSFSGIPTGTWRVTVFDQWNDLLVDGLSTPVQVAGSVVNVEIPVTQWRANLYTRTFLDVGDGTAGSVGDGVSQPNEPGLPLVATNIRYRDGSYAFFNNTDLNGYAGFNEVFPFLNWLVVETDTTRFKQTGAHVVYDSGGPVDGTTGAGSSTIAAALANTLESPTAHLPPSLRVPGAVYCDNADCTGFSIQSGPTSSAASPSTGRIDPPWATTQAWQGLLGQNSFIEWGMKPFMPGENGGIKGHVLYASTRPFDDPALYLQLSWLPAVPNVTLNLYQVGTAPDGTRSLKLVDTTQSSSWDAWAQGFRSDGVSNMNCPGQEIDSPFYFSLLDSKQWLNPTTPIPGGAAGQNSRFKCYDGWSMLNQVQPAPYDGMYKFPSIIGRDPLTGVPAGAGSVNGTPGSRPGSNCTICGANPDDGTPMLPVGKYVVEVILPPGYELVKEEDKNLLLGDVYIAPITQQFAGLGNIFIMPDQAAINAFYNKSNPGGLIKTTNFGLPRHEGDTGSVETFWPCVGATRIVPDWMSLFVGATQNAPFAGASRPLCDRKEVTLADQMTVLAKFYVFSSTHVAGHFTGTITNDFASEFDPFSPQFGEKFAPPNMPVSFKDFAGNEVSRVYADQWGIFNGLFFSTWGVNPPNPTGYVPQMAIACMNHPGPIPDPAHPGQTMTDPLYNPAYSNFCYETPFMPGQTQYMDTPVIPTMAFAEGYNPPNCEYPDTTPAIKSVTGDPIPGSTGRGPWVSTTGNTHRLTINALGDKTVLNDAYSGPRASTAPFNQKFITRHYGFGSTPGTVTITNPNGNPVQLGGVTWSDTTISAFVPAGVCPPSGVCPANYGGELVITAANGKRSIDTVTVSVGGTQPKYVTQASPSSTTFGQTFPNPLQTAIDNATPGDLIIVGPGTYQEMLLMWKPVRLQGVGASSVTIDADAHPAGTLDPWRRQVNCLFGLALNGQPISATNPYDATNTYSCSTAMRQKIDRIPLEGILGWDTTMNGNLAEMLQEPSLMGAYEGAGITVLAKGVRIPANSTDFWGSGAEAGFPAGHQYLTGSNADCTATSTTPGRDYATSNFNCNPSRIDGVSITNSSQGGGGIYLHGWNHRMEIANNRIYANHGTLSGGINVGSGEFPDAFICDAGALDGTTPLPFSGCTLLRLNQQLGYGFNTNVRLHHNAVTSNASIGDALFSGTPSAGGGVTLYPGSDNYQFKNNWVCGNLSTGDGGGVMHAGFNTNGNISNNSIIFNQSMNPTIPTHGGGLLIEGAAPDRMITTGPNAGQECGTINDLDCPPGLSEGAGPGLVINANLIMGNSAESGSGGGLRIQSVNGTEVGTFPLLPMMWYGVTVTNNIIANNVAGWDGGGVSMQDSLKVDFINNTVISNDTTGSAGVLFNTLGAPNASVPPPGCNPQQDPTLPQDPSCSGLAPDSTFQPAGLVTMRHTPYLLASLPPAGPGLLQGVNCPMGHGAVNDGECRQVSYPLLVNNIFWQNRAFKIVVGDFGSGLQNQQHLVALSPLLNQPAAPAVASGVVTGGTGACASGANYWDIGVRGDTGPTNHGSLFTLNPMSSILTSFSGSYNNNGNLAPAASGVVEQYCNGSRVPPENGGKGYGAPPGRSETTGLSPVFTMNSISAAATVDEGNNWINLSYGPLSLWSTAGQDMLAAAPVGPALGAYSITFGSAARNATSVVGNALAPNADFFGNSRAKTTSNLADIGAVEYTGGSGAIPAVTPASLAFGNVGVGTTSASQNLTLSNNGGAQLNGISIAVTAPFSRSTAGTFPTGAPNCGTTLATNTACTVKVVFTPTVLGAATGTVTIAASVGVANSPVSLSGTGAGAVATATVSPTSLAFGNWATGTTSTSSALTVTNTGNGGLTGLGVGPFPTGFSRDNSGTFPAGAPNCGTTLAAGASCTVKVAFAPGATVGTFNSTVPFAATGWTFTPAWVIVSGTGVNLAVNPASLAFGGQFVGTPSPAQTLTVRNSTGSARSLTATFTGPFLRPAGAAGGTCVPLPLADGGSCTINVAFRPTATGTPTGSVAIATDGGFTVANSPVDLSGAVAPTLTPARWIAQATPRGAGTQGPTQTFTLTNTASVNLTGIHPGVVGGTNAADFAIVAPSTCGTTGFTTLAPNATCVVTVQFRPLTSEPAGGKNATLSVTDAAGTQSSALSGTADFDGV